MRAPAAATRRRSPPALDRPAARACLCALATRALVAAGAWAALASSSHPNIFLLLFRALRFTLAANYGANRLHAFVRMSSEYASTVGASSAVSAVLAPENSPSAVLRQVTLAKAPDPTLTDEWHEVLADFYLLKQELGTSGQQMQLRVTLGTATATAGSAWLTDLTLEQLPSANVADFAPIVARFDSNDAAGSTAVPASGLVDLSTTSPTWSIFDNNMVKDEVWFVIDLDATYVICSVSVNFAISAKVTDWKLFLAEDEGSTLSTDELWPVEVLHVSDRSWPTSVYTSDDALAVMANGDWTPNNWDETIWRYLEFDDNPISSNRRYFTCTAANRAKLSLLHTNNIIFSLMEIQVFGYEEDIHGLCSLRCRHGGKCEHRSETVCTCPSKWGWQGTVCDVDVDECALNPSDQKARDRVPTIVAANGGCGAGSLAKANCTNTPGSWNCTCKPGYTGASSTGDDNTCEDVNECLVAQGGCKDICLNSPGSYRCACNDGYDLAQGVDSSSLSDNTNTSDDVSIDTGAGAGIALHRVTQLPLEGAACQPHCDQACQHGGVCERPNECAPCDDGWHGRYCDTAACTSTRRYQIDGIGPWLEDKGCYHGGQCVGVDGCSKCLGGWSGDACETVSGSMLPLLVGMCSALLIAPSLIIVLVKWSWPPFQERNVAVLILGGIGGILTVSTSPAASNAVLYGISLDAFDVQPESQMWGLWLPFVAGYALWFTGLLVRARNLVVQHLRGGLPMAGTFHMLLAWAPWAASSILPPPVGSYLYIALLVVLGGYYAMLCLQLLPLRKDLDDLLPSMFLGLCAQAAMVGLSVMRLGGASYANPEGGVQVIFPFVVSGCIGSHFFITVFRGLVWKLLRKDQAIMEKYDAGSDSEEYSDDEVSTAVSRWKKGIGGARTAAILKLSADGAAARPAGNGLLGMLAKKKNAGDGSDGSDDDGDATTSSESGSEYESSADESEAKRVPPPQQAPPAQSSSSEEASSGADEDDSSDYDAEPTSSRGGRGRGRGGGGRAGRGRWNRGSRAAFHRGRGAGRGGSRTVMPVGAPSAPEVVAPQKNAIKQMKAATIFARVQKTVVAPLAESDDDLTSSSSDDELEELANEVKRFEKMMSKKVAGPGFVPVFTAPAQAHGASEHTSLDTIMQKRILRRERQLYEPDEEDIMDSLAFEMTETEKLAAAQREQSSRPSKDTESGSYGVPGRPEEQPPSAAAPPERGRGQGQQQKIVSETEEDIEIEMGPHTYLVDLESGMVFLLAATGEPPEVGAWDAAERRIVFD